MNNLTDAVYDATIYTDTLDAEHARAEVDAILANVVASLRRDPRFPKLSIFEWDLLFGDVRRDAEHSLTELIDGQVDLDEVVNAIVYAANNDRYLAKKITRKKMKKTKSQQQPHYEQGRPT